MQFTGALTAIVTPFANGEVDEESYRALIEWQIESGIQGLVPCGTTGESATLSHEEHKRVVRICVDQVKKRVPVLAGAGSNNTLEAVELTRSAKQAGADGALHITPYYNKPTPAGLIEHFAAVAREVPMPIIVYNVPGRTSLNVLPATLAAIRGRDLGHFQHRPGQDERPGERLFRREHQKSPGHPLRDIAAEPGHVPGNQPHPGQDRPGGHG